MISRSVGVVVVVAATEFALSAVGTAVTHAQTNPVSQARSTRIGATQVSAPGFGPFISNQTSGTPGSFLFQSSTQQSTISPGQVQTGVGFSFLTGVFGGVRNIDVASNFTYTFQVVLPVTYVATGSSQSMMGIGSGTTFAQLTGPGGSVFVFDGNAPVPLTFATSGTLTPGHYTLHARSETIGSTQTANISGTGGISVTLAFSGGLACDSIDFNNDSAVFDPQDIEALLSVYGEGSCVPATNICNDIDFNNDGSLFDPCDIAAFLLVFSEGPCTICGE